MAAHASTDLFRPKPSRISDIRKYHQRLEPEGSNARGLPERIAKHMAIKFGVHLERFPATPSTHLMEVERAAAIVEMVLAEATEL